MGIAQFSSGLGPDDKASLNSIQNNTNFMGYSNITNRYRQTRILTLPGADYSDKTVLSVTGKKGFLSLAIAALRDTPNSIVTNAGKLMVTLDGVLNEYYYYSAASVVGLMPLQAGPISFAGKANVPVIFNDQYSNSNYDRLEPLQIPLYFANSCLVQLHYNGVNPNIFYYSYDVGVW